MIIEQWLKNAFGVRKKPKPTMNAKLSRISQDLAGSRVEGGLRPETPCSAVVPLAIASIFRTAQFCISRLHTSRNYSHDL
jgi:hypothetical protein